MNRLLESTKPINVVHVAAMADSGRYCFVAYATQDGHSYVFSIEAEDIQELEVNIRTMFTSIKSQHDDGDISKDLASVVSRIILNEHSNA